MKKKILLLLAFLFIIGFSIFAFADNKDDDKGVPQILLQIKNILSGILEKITIVAEKNETIQVTVNPNINISKDECQWEKFNFETNIDFIETEEVVEFGNRFTQTKYILRLPLNLGYSDIKVNAGRIFAECPGNCDFKINEIHCGTLTRNFKGLKEYPSACINAVFDGLNKITIDRGGAIHKLYLEMKILPANC